MAWKIQIHKKHLPLEWWHSVSLFSEPLEPILSHGLWAVVLELKVETCFFLYGEVSL